MSDPDTMELIQHMPGGDFQPPSEEDVATVQRFSLADFKVGLRATWRGDALMDGRLAIAVSAEHDEWCQYAISIARLSDGEIDRQVECRSGAVRLARDGAAKMELIARLLEAEAARIRFRVQELT